jgi:ABC-type branched-subunit amino acid transport system ATPase component
MDGRTNIGIVGRQNEGKSTLTNCLCGVKHGTPGSAKIGEAQVTTIPTPYPDGKHTGFVWHDIPGGGVRDFRAWGYYYNLRLFAYDKILLVHTSTLSEVRVSLPRPEHGLTRKWPL